MLCDRELLYACCVMVKHRSQHAVLEDEFKGFSTWRSFVLHVYLGDGFESYLVSLGVISAVTAPFRQLRSC